jgi:hypothetical protein
MGLPTLSSAFSYKVLTGTLSVPDVNLARQQVLKVEGKQSV